MKKNAKKEEKTSSDSGTSLPVDKPESVEMSPEVSTTSQKGPSVLSRGVEMEKVDSPRFGAPGAATGMRSAAGGGAYSPSAQVGRTPSNPEMRGAGSDPMNKMDIRDELAWNDIGAEQYRTLVDGSPAGFAPEAILGNFTFEDNLCFQFDNAGSKPGVRNSPYRRRVVSLSKDQCVFVTGQHDNAAKGAMQFYPIKTYTKGQARSVTTLPAGSRAVRGNYLMRGMTVNISRENSSLPYQLASVKFDTVSLETESSPADLDVRQDNARVLWDIADRDITRNYFELVNKAENLQANKYSPLPDGQPDAIQHLILARDIAATDGTIAMLALRSAMETYAYHRTMRSVYGSGDGSKAQARAMLAERTMLDDDVGTFLWADNQAMEGANPVDQHEEIRNFVYLNAPAYIQTFLDSPTKYNNDYGVWVTLPRGLRLLFEEAQKSFDDCGQYIDRDTYAIIDNIFGWRDCDGRMAGVGRIGIIAPVDYNQIYQTSDNLVTVGDDGDIHSKFIMDDYVLNGSQFNEMEIRSPLVDAILRVVAYRIMPKLKGQDTFSIYIPFDFACDHYSFGQCVLMEAFAYMHPYLHPARAIFDRFAQQYGVDPLLGDTMQQLKLADVIKTSSYKGIGANQTLPAASEGLRLLLQLPEVYQCAFDVWDRATEYPDVGFAIKFTDLAPLSDNIDQPQKLLFPMFYRTENLPQWRRVFDMGPEKLLRSRDFPIHRYNMYTTNFELKPAAAIAPYDDRMPFFECQAPKVYHCERASTGALSLSVGAVLRAPRYAGRITPAPMGLLDFVRVPSGLSPSYGSFTDYALSLTGSSGNLKYGWLASPADNIISLDGDSNSATLTGYDIENYRTSFVYMEPYSNNLLGMLLHRYCVHFNSGCLSQDSIESLRDDYGIWLDPSMSEQVDIDCAALIGNDELEITVPASGNVSISTSYSTITISGNAYSLDPDASDYVGSTITTLTVQETGLVPGFKKWKISNAAEADVSATVTGGNHGFSMFYMNDAIKMWVYDNVLPFIYSPYTGNLVETVTDESEKFGEINYDLTNALTFGMAGYQALYYDRLNVDIYASKQATGGRVYDNSILHKNNIFFE